MKRILVTRTYFLIFLMTELFYISVAIFTSPIPIIISEEGINISLRRMRILQEESLSQEGKRYVEVAGISLPYIGSSSYRVPGDNGFIVTPALKKIIHNIGLAFQDSFPVMLIGESGIGKSAIIRYIAHKTKAPFYWIAMSRRTTIEDLIGHEVVRGDKVEFVPGPLLKAADPKGEGGIILLDDANLARPGVLKWLHSLLDNFNRTIEIRKDGQIQRVKVHPDFRIVIAMNPVTYSRRNELGEEFETRFVKIGMEPLPREELQEILKAKIDSRLHAVIGPMLDIYEFVKQQTEELYSRTSGKYYFGLRDLLDMAEYIQAFEGKEPLVDTFAYAANYVFRRRLEPSDDPRLVEHHQLRHEFDTYVAQVEIEGRRPDMEKVLYYENLKIEDLKAFAADTAFGKISYLLDKVLLKSSITDDIKNLLQILGKGVDSIKIAGYQAIDVFPEEIVTTGIEELKNFICNEENWLGDRIRALEVLIKLAESRDDAKELLKSLDQNGDLPSAMQIYAGAALVKLGVKTDPSDIEELKYLLLHHSHESNIPRTRNKEVIVARMIEALGWLKIDKTDIETIERLKELVMSGEQPVYRAQAAKVLISIGAGLKEIKDTFVSLAESLSDFEKQSAVLIAKEAFTPKMLNNKIKELLQYLSTLDDLSISVPALEARIKLNVEPDSAKETLKKLFKQAAIKDKVEKLVPALLRQGLVTENEILEASMKYLSLEFEAKPEPPYAVAVLLTQILKGRIASGIGEFQDEITSALQKISEMSDLMPEIINLLKRFGIEFEPQEGEIVPDLASMNFIITPKTLADLEAILPALALRHPVLLVGETAVGKSQLIQFIAALVKHKYTTVPVSGDTDSDDLVGTFGSDGKGGVAWIRSELVTGVEEGWFTVVEEINLPRSDALERLNTLLDKGGYMEVPEYHEGYKVEAHPDFWLIGTMNPIGSAGTNELSPAFFNRFRGIWIEDYTKEELIEIVQRGFKLGETMADLLVSFHLQIRGDALKRAFGEERPFPYRYNLRDLIKVATALKHVDLSSLSWKKKLEIMEGYVRTFYEGDIPKDSQHPDRIYFETLINAFFHQKTGG